MSNQTVEQYIEHEVQLRLIDKRFDLYSDKFKHIDDSIRHLDSKLDESVRHLDNKFNEWIHHMDNKLNWMLVLVVSSIFLPVVFHLFKLI